MMLIMYLTLQMYVAMYLTTLELVAESAFETNVLKIPASAPSGIYELEFPRFCDSGQKGTAEILSLCRSFYI